MADGQMNALSSCPCGLPASYESCCGRFIDQQTFAETPEQLMRSRYTAYTQANVDYIKKTMCGAALNGFDVDGTRSWARSVDWVSLEVTRVSRMTLDDTEGSVEFTFNYVEAGQSRSVYECSFFRKIDGRWYYISGAHDLTALTQQVEKVTRNDPCPCGSGKKYKKCCYIAW